MPILSPQEVNSRESHCKNVHWLQLSNLYQGGEPCQNDIKEIISTCCVVGFGFFFFKKKKGCVRAGAYIYV